MIITSPANPRLKQLRRLLREGEKTQGGPVLIEGPKLIAEAIDSEIQIEKIYLQEGLRDDRLIQPLVTKALRAGCELIEVSKRLFAALSDAETPQGIIALGKLPVFSLQELLKGLPLLVLAVGLQDPGNVGTLLRSSEAFGAAGVLLTENSSSPRSPKVIRASAGSIFRLPWVEHLDSSTLLSLLRQNGFTLIAAAPKSHLDFRSASYLGKTALVVGNEARGLNEAILQQTDCQVCIPISKRVESLNVATATAIILCEAARQRMQMS